MGLKLILHKNIHFILIVLVVIIGVLFHDKLQSLYKSFKDPKLGVKNKNKGLFSEEELSQYDGVKKEKLYLSLMGMVFDVTRSKMHYGVGGSYNYFVGKDGSRSFVTGNFKDETEDKDHVIDLSCEELFGLLQWKVTFDQKYKSIGVLIGRYYDVTGQPTAYTKQLEEKADWCRIDKEKSAQIDNQFPPCNMEWSVTEGSRVWCTKNSGGVNRGWIGVPRQMYTPGEDNPQCVCINLHKDNSAVLLKEYDDCMPDSTSCVIVNN